MFTKGPKMTEDIKRIDIKDAAFLTTDDPFALPVMPIAAMPYEDERVHVEAQRHERTLTFIKYALQLDAIDEGWLYEQKGWMFNQLQRYREALVAFERARHLGYADDSWLHEQKTYALNKLACNDESLETVEHMPCLDYANDK
jgi:tetratricopeptide (TPR) repeat protein